MKVTWEVAEQRYPGCSAEYDRDIVTVHGDVEVDLVLYADGILRAKDVWCMICPVTFEQGSYSCRCASYDLNSKKWKIL